MDMNALLEFLGMRPRTAQAETDAEGVYQQPESERQAQRDEYMARVNAPPPPPTDDLMEILARQQADPSVSEEVAQYMQPERDNLARQRQYWTESARTNEAMNERLANRQGFEYTPPGPEMNTILGIKDRAPNPDRYGGAEAAPTPDVDMEAIDAALGLKDPTLASGRYPQAAPAPAPTPSDSQTTEDFMASLQAFGPGGRPATGAGYAPPPQTPVPQSPFREGPPPNPFAGNQPPPSQPSNYRPPPLVIGPGGVTDNPQVTEQMVREAAARRENATRPQPTVGYRTQNIPFSGGAAGNRPFVEPSAAMRLAEGPRPGMPIIGEQPAITQQQGPAPFVLNLPPPAQPTAPRPAPRPAPSPAPQSSDALNRAELQRFLSANPTQPQPTTPPSAPAPAPARSVLPTTQPVPPGAGPTVPPPPPQMGQPIPDYVKEQLLAEAMRLTQQRQPQANPLKPPAQSPPAR